MRNPSPRPTPAGTDAQPLDWAPLVRALAAHPQSVGYAWQWLTQLWNREAAAFTDRVVVCGPAADAHQQLAPAAWTQVVAGWDPLVTAAAPPDGRTSSHDEASGAGLWYLYLDPGLCAGVVDLEIEDGAREQAAYAALDAWLHVLAQHVPLGTRVVLQIPTTESVSTDLAEDSFGGVADQVVHRRQVPLDGVERWGVTWQMLYERVLYRASQQLVLRSALQWRRVLETAGWTLGNAGMCLVPRSEELAGCTTAICVATRG